jgi:hypothetical protein
MPETNRAIGFTTIPGLRRTHCGKSIPDSLKRSIT